MKNIKFAAVGIALAFASPVAAADLSPVYKAAPAVIATNWTGFYLGANAGWGTSKNCWDFNTGGAFVPEGCHDAQGFIAGGQLGYRSQFGSLVLGLEAQGDWASMRGDNNSTRLLVPQYSNRTKVNAIGLFTGQIGYNFNTLLLYAKGGVALTSNTYEGFITNNLVVFDKGETGRVGASAGVGFEYALTQNWSAGVEYNHLFLAEKDYTRNSAAPAPVINGSGRITADADMVTFRVNYRFGGPAPAVAARY